MQVLDMNRATVVSWLEGRGTYSRQGVLVAVPGKGAHTALIGDWIVKTYGGEVFVLPDEIFTSIYSTRKMKRKVLL